MLVKSACTVESNSAFPLNDHGVLPVVREDGAFRGDPLQCPHRVAGTNVTQGHHLHRESTTGAVGRRVERLDEPRARASVVALAGHDQGPVRLSPITTVPGASAFCNDVTTSSGRA